MLSQFRLNSLLSNDKILDEDNLLDIVVANLISKNIGIFFGYGNDTFLLRKIYFTNSNYDLNSISMNDVNNDTVLDILIVDFNIHNSSIGIFYGFVNSNFTLHRTYPTGLNSHPTSIVKSILPLPAIIKILSKSCFNWKLNLLRHQHYFPLVINLIQNQSLLVILTTMIT